MGLLATLEIRDERVVQDLKGRSETGGSARVEALGAAAILSLAQPSAAQPSLLACRTTEEGTCKKKRRKRLLEHKEE